MAKNSRSTGKLKRPGVKSNKIRHLESSRDAYGLKVKPKTRVLGQSAMLKRAVENRQKQQDRMKGTYILMILEFDTNIPSEMTAEQRRALLELHEVHEHADDSDHDYSPLTLNDVLDGQLDLDISHAGGEYEELKAALLRNLAKP